MNINWLIHDSEVHMHSIVVFRFTEVLYRAVTKYMYTSVIPDVQLYSVYTSNMFYSKSYQKQYSNLVSPCYLQNFILTAVGK